MPDRPFVSLTTDFGASYTAICAGVIYSITPSANVLVLSDEVTPYAVVEGAMLLRQALPYLPVGVHVGIVDPGVGTSRRPVAVVTGRGDVLVGPDNGLLPPAAEVLGGAVHAYELVEPAYRLPEVSTSFHGRDVFSPAAAHLAAGLDPAALGPRVAPADLLPFAPPPAARSGDRLTASVMYVDRFGSLVLGARREDLPAAEYGAPLEVAWTAPDGAPRSVRAPFAETFGAVPKGEPLLWVDSSGWLGFAVNQGSAADRYGLDAEAVLTIRPLPQE
ncbi:hypothetical protein Arub01_07950 [Actinomadura rubrobrunea]|uniref:SAM-dependent chlorinase/fluorinase n=1 Tax=Actinomadura rubrobrunea TaxID=115335 RepID=A0A9W6USD8_9ACTN|nr:SAM-dependent chlorinase/fluorinase [Actinomadura rubrobrunea]GLW62551.1 hypothetical protein Arub01_07950 [Actinomadura rubrobrunea]